MCLWRHVPLPTGCLLHQRGRGGEGWGGVGVGVVRVLKGSASPSWRDVALCWVGEVGGGGGGARGVVRVLKGCFAILERCCSLLVGGRGRGAAEGVRVFRGSDSPSWRDVVLCWLGEGGGGRRRGWASLKVQFRHPGEMFFVDCSTAHYFCYRRYCCYYN